MDDPALARCQCGALTATCHGEPTRVSVCHCFGCKARTGSDFGVSATYPTDRVDLAGEAREWQRLSDDGNLGRQYFCPTCGTTVYWSADVRPGQLYVALGGVGTQDIPPPTFEVYRERMMKPLDLKISPEPTQQ